MPGLRWRVSAVVSLVLLALVLCPLKCQCTDYPRPEHQLARLATTYTYQINQTVEYIFHYIVTKENENFIVETKVEPIDTHSKISLSYPVIFQVRHLKNSQSWRIPFKSPAKRIYDTVNRTICINEHASSSPISQKGNSSTLARQTQKTGNLVTVTVSTLYRNSVKFSLTVRNVCQLLDLEETRNVTVTPTSAYLLHFHFPQNVNEVMVILSSEDRKCLTVSIQQPTCPFLDQEHSIQYKGYWHTMTKKGAVTVPKTRYPDGFFVVLVLHSKDDQCFTRYGYKFLHSSDSKDDSINDNDYDENIEQPRSKLVTVHIKDSLKDISIPVAVLWPVILQIGIIVLTIGALRWTKYENATFATQSQNDEETGNELKPLPSDESNGEQIPIPLCLLNRNQSSSSLQQNQQDPRPAPPLPPIRNSQTSSPPAQQCPKPFVTLDQLTKKSPEKLERKSKLFLLFVIPMAIYYCLPALQLVLMYLTTSHKTGNLDMCYYNFQCAYPLWIFNDFNHFISNVPYVLEGIFAATFIYLHKNKYTNGIGNLERTGYGVPGQFGVSYGLALAILTEGLLSMSYHVCPNRSNFHHDTCFMFVAITLSALRLYHARHPDPAIGATTAFVLLGILMVLDLMGELLEHWGSLAFFTALHFVVFFLVATQMYFLGKRSMWSFKNILAMICNNGKVDEDNNPVASRDLYNLLIVEFVVNLGLIGSGWYRFMTKPVFDFGTHLLLILGLNTIVYLIYYLLMKRIRGEGLNAITRVLLVISGCFWVSGAVNFASAKSSWEKSPALSREKNEHCSFYDSHDIWHILSAGALYTTLMLLEFIDINVWNKPQSEIAVF